jgi:hypothetical protein
VHDATTVTADGPTAIKAGYTQDGWSALSAVAPRAKAEAIPILSPRARLTGFALALPILRTDLDQKQGGIERETASFAHFSDGTESTSQQRALT